MRFLWLCFAVLLAACDAVDVGRSNLGFAAVADRIAPVATDICETRSAHARCDFHVIVDDRPDQPPNAYQSVSETGQPIVTITSSMLAELRNADEIALVLGHEMAHHIEDHIARLNRTAARLALRSDGGTGQMALVEQLKRFELEADALGARIAARAGYDALRGAAVIARLPDPGARGSYSHPGTAARLAAVAQSMQ